MITINNTMYDTMFKSLLQSYITIYLNNKIWREGQLILFKQSGYYIELTLKDKEKNMEKFEIPLPFDIIKNSNKVNLSYKLTSLSYNDSILSSMLQKLDISKSKFYDNVLTIEVAA